MKQLKDLSQLNCQLQHLILIPIQDQLLFIFQILMNVLKVMVKQNVFIKYDQIIQFIQLRIYLHHYSIQGMLIQDSKVQILLPNVLIVLYNIFIILLHVSQVVNEHYLIPHTYVGYVLLSLIIVYIIPIIFISIFHSLLFPILFQLFLFIIFQLNLSIFVIQIQIIINQYDEQQIKYIQIHHNHSFNQIYYISLLELEIKISL